MKLNGKLVFKGTNRHEFDCYRGRAMDPASRERDILTMTPTSMPTLLALSEFQLYLCTLRPLWTLCHR